MRSSVDAARPPGLLRAAARSSSPPPSTIVRGPGAPGSVRFLRFSMVEASAVMPIDPRCFTKSPTLLCLALTRLGTWEWLLARLALAVAFTTPFFCRMRMASRRTAAAVPSSRSCASTSMLEPPVMASLSAGVIEKSSFGSFLMAAGCRLSWTPLRFKKIAPQVSPARRIFRVYFQTTRTIRHASAF
eukprot:scaffold91154_cov32-Phaeocystis_antarctica.AAC.2